jgi:hypothetical protein
LLGLFFDPEDGVDVSLQNIDWLSLNHMTLYPTRENSLLRTSSAGSAVCVMFVPVNYRPINEFYLDK